MDDALWGRTTVGCNPKQTTTVPSSKPTMQLGASSKDLGNNELGHCGVKV